MVPYAGKDIPAGWIACDNASYPTTAYPQLFAKIGYTYGTDDTKYRVPDTRGVFMRGIDATATRDTNRPAGSIQLSGTVPDTNSVFIGASASATGGVGYVPAPMAGQQNHVLTGAGTWTPAITAMTPVTLSGNSIMFSNIPGSARRVTVMLANVGIGGNTYVRLRLGAGDIVASGYKSNVIFAGQSTNGEFVDDGFRTNYADGNGRRRNGAYTLSHLGNNTWVCTGHFSSWYTYIDFCAGSITLSGVLDRVQLSIGNANDTFVAGTVNVMYE
jgi:microcystin-dependent protein